MTLIALEQFPPALRSLLILSPGDDGILTIDSLPVARLQPLLSRNCNDAAATTPKLSERRPGGARGEVIRIAADFDAPLEEFGDL